MTTYKDLPNATSLRGSVITRPVWVVWIMGVGQAVCRFLDDKVVEEGFTICEYPALIAEQAEQVGPGQMKIGFQMRPLSLLVDLETVPLRLMGYLKCKNEKLIEAWEATRKSVQSNHSLIAKP